MDSRRDFLKRAAASLPPGLAAVFFATGCKSTGAELESVGDVLGRLPDNILYSAERPGKWRGRVKAHVPEVRLDGEVGKIVTNHEMAPDHFIVRHSLVTPRGELLFSRTFKREDKKAISVFSADEDIRVGRRCVALSFCNRHDLWIAEVTL